MKLIQFEIWLFCFVWNWYYHDSEYWYNDNWFLKQAAVAWWNVRQKFMKRLGVMFLWPFYLCYSRNQGNLFSIHCICKLRAWNYSWKLIQINNTRNKYELPHTENLELMNEMGSAVNHHWTFKHH